MKRHVALTLLIITTLGVVDAHVDLNEVDGRRFLATQGRLYDPLGWLEDQANALTRSCGAVQRVDLKDSGAQAVLARIREFSPPQSHSAQLHQVLRSGPWWLAEVSFDALNPAVVVLRESAEGVKIVEPAIWSGSTQPWRVAPRIRRHLRAGAPDMPAQLPACLEPQTGLFES
jgi:hypothetical protein